MIMKKLFTIALLLIASNTMHGQSSLSFGCGGSALDYGRSICTDADGNIFVAGSFNGQVDFDPDPVNTFYLTSAAGENEAFLAKYDSSGNLVFANIIGNSGVVFFAERGTSIVADNNGNIYFAGIMDANSLIAKFNNDGDSLWAFPLADMDLPQIALDNQGHVFVGGSYFLDSADFDPGPNTFTLTPVGGLDIVVARYDTSGNFNWAYSMGGDADDHLFGLAPDHNGGVYVTGDYFSNTINFSPTVYSSTASNTQGAYLARLNTSGALAWNVSIEGQQLNDNNYGANVKTDASGNAYWLGNFSQTHDFDPTATVTNLVATTNYDQDMFLVKYRPNGTIAWSFTIPDLYSGTPEELAIDNHSNIYLTGNIGGTTDFKPGADTAFVHVPVNHDYDVFVAKYDSAGNYLYAYASGGKGSDLAYSISIDPSNNVLLTGYYSDTACFDRSNPANTIVSHGSYDIFVARYTDFFIVTDVKSDENYQPVSLFPNPVSTNAKLDFVMLNPGTVKILISDITGRIIKELPDVHCKTGNNSIDLEARELGTGFYLITILGGESKLTYKFQKM